MERKSFVPFKSCHFNHYLLPQIGMSGWPSCLLTTGATKSLGRNLTSLCNLEECRGKASEIKSIQAATTTTTVALQHPLPPPPLHWLSLLLLSSSSSFSSLLFSCFSLWFFFKKTPRIKAIPFVICIGYTLTTDHTSGCTLIWDHYLFLFPY